MVAVHDLWEVVGTIESDTFPSKCGTRGGFCDVLIVSS